MNVNRSFESHGGVSEDIENLADSLSAAQDETKAVLSDVMRLPERFRVPIVLYYYLGFSTAEIAELLHVPAATVRTRLARGRSKLKIDPRGGRP